MLHYSTIDNPTLELLKGLLEVPSFKNMYLAGGTSLALQIGHRKSIDLDLFGVHEMDDISIAKILSTLGKPQLIKKTLNIQIYTVNGVKVDIVNYHYPWIQVACVEDQLRLAGKKDIAAMKLAAITGRSSRKDFIDIFFLLQEFSLQEMLGFYSEKYIDGSSFLVLKSLTYFDEADKEPQPFMLKEIDWKHIKHSIVGALNSF